MKKNDYVVPAMIAAGCELLVICLAVIVVALQNVIVPLFYSNSSMAGGKIVFPTGIIFSIVHLLFYLGYTAFVGFYNGKHRRMIGVIVIALIILLGLVSGIFSFISGYVGSAMGMTAMENAKLSIVNSLISIVNLLPGMLITPLFFISVGRFGISDPDNMD